MTRLEIEAHTGYSRSWLWSHQCGWCDQTIWIAVKYGCAAIYEKCDPKVKFSDFRGKVADARRRI
jgi:hypothetical protein